MILVDNRNVLRLKNRDLLNRLSAMEGHELTGQVIVEQAKTGVPTIKITHDGKTQFLQSKYDPQKEAERFAGKFADESIKYALFIGIGTGYHIQSFMEAHPDAKFAIYEPNEEVMHAYLSNFRLDTLPVRNLTKIFTGTENTLIVSEVQQLLAASNNMVKIITLPVYEKIYGNKVQVILEKALAAIKDKHSELATNIAFQKRWTINSIKNFPTVLKVPNILHDIDRNNFDGKPAIIVAAGPSLNEEFEHLRYIKENGLAYIFSVGSAINALIEKGIYPDAACTYDPKERNQNVIKVIKDRNIEGIPLIFGTSVGYETIENYPGILLSMITSQDSISKHLLQENANFEIINDAPSIAVITLQLLMKIGFTEIILVGQNLSFKNDKRFAEGINYEHINNSIRNEESKNLVSVKDVHGDKVLTEEMYISMLDQLVFYIKANPQVVVINTTKGGAAIEGAEFVELATLIETKLIKNIVKKNWFRGEVNYDLNHIIKKLTILNEDYRHLNRQLKEVGDIIDRILENESLSIVSKLEGLHILLDKKVSLISNNLYYQVVLKPMMKTQYEKLQEDILKLKYEQNIMKKSREILSAFTPFIITCTKEYQSTSSLFLELFSTVKGMSNDEES